MMGRRAVQRACLLTIVAFSRLAVAQPKVDANPKEAEAPKAPKLEAPAIKRDPGAQYPLAALKAKVREPVSVVLMLDIDAAGVVQKATVEAPVGNGFDEAAVDAAQKLEFVPAKKDGQPMASRIKYRMEFPVQKANVKGRLIGAPDEVPLAGATVVVERDVSVGAAAGTSGNPPAESQTATANAKGVWTVEGLPPGTYKITIKADGYKSITTVEDLDPGSETALTLRLPSVAPEPSAATNKVDSEIEEVTIRAKRPPREVTKRTFEQRELARIPGTNGDALRALQNFPGVARPPALAGLLIVRGSGPNETNVFVDGTLVPLVYHFGGLSSVIPTEMIEKIDFYPGNFSATYGRVTGGIVDVGIRDPKTDRIHGLAQVDLIDARVAAEGPLPLGEGWSFAVAGRRSWFDAWLGPVLEGVGAGVTTAPVYYDYQAVVNKKIDSKQSLRFSFFGSDDRLKVLLKSASGSDPSLSGTASLGTAFYRAQARYRNKVSDDTELRLVGAVGKDAINFNLGDNYFQLTTYPITLRAEVSQKMAKGVTSNFGIDWLWSPYDVAVRFPPAPRPGEPPGGPFLSRPPLTVRDSDAIYRPGFYNEWEIVPWKGARIVSGARVDYSKDTKAWDVSPRFVVRQDVTESPRTTVKGGVGVFRQPPQPQETNRVFGIPGLSSNRAIHYSLGVERQVTREIEASLEGFYRDLDNLVVQRVGNTGVGASFGLETLIRYKPDGRFFGFIAYTLSRSVRKDLPTEPERLFNFDQTHILTTVGSYKLGRGWEIGGRYRIVSGSMNTPRQYGFFDENAGSYLPISYPPSGQRLPTFHQLDVRIDKTWMFKAWQLSAYLDVINAYNAANVEGISYNYNSTQSAYGAGLPIIPSIGVRGEF